MKAKLQLEEQYERVTAEWEEIKARKGGKAGQVWEIRKRVLWGKKANNVAASIINPHTGKLIVGKKDIMERVEDRFKTEINGTNDKEKKS